MHKKQTDENIVQELRTIFQKLIEDDIEGLNGHLDRYTDKTLVETIKQVQSQKKI